MIAGVRDLPSLDAGGKSELRRAGCFVTRSRGDAKESATERKPPDKGSPKNKFTFSGVEAPAWQGARRANSRAI